MQIHRVRGKDLRDALRRAGEQFGAEALFLSHETMPDGDVMVAVADPVRTLVTRGEVAGPAQAPSPRSRAASDVERVLARSTTSRALTDKVLAHVAKTGASGPYALDAAAQFLGQQVEVAPGPRLPARNVGAALQPCVLAFVGPTGVGKTTTLAKIASRMARVGRRVSLVSMDLQRPGAVDQLAGFAAAMQAPFEIAADGAALTRILARSGERDCVLIDTTGRSPRDARALAELAAGLGVAAAGASLSTYLVLSAAASPSALEEARRAFAPTRPDAWIVTKLDETRAPAPVLEASAAAHVGVAFLCDGPDVEAHLERANPERFADLFLRGRLA
jgi:flagellar biosynthesis GTPase FlhF